MYLKKKTTFPNGSMDKQDVGFSDIIITVYRAKVLLPVGSATWKTLLNKSNNTQHRCNRSTRRENVWMEINFRTLYKSGLKQQKLTWMSQKGWIPVAVSIVESIFSHAVCTQTENEPIIWFMKVMYVLGNTLGYWNATGSPVMFYGRISRFSVYRFFQEIQKINVTNVGVKKKKKWRGVKKYLSICIGILYIFDFLWFAPFLQNTISNIMKI